MQSTWNYDLTELLRQAQRGNLAELDEFVARFAPLAATNEDHSVLLTLRQFEATWWQDQRRVLNCAPKGELFQWGVTVTSASADGASQCNAYLPNQPACTGLRLRGQEVELLLPTGNRLTNVTELVRKLLNYGAFTEEDVAAAFGQLCNEQYAARKPARLPVRSPTLELPTFGILTHQAPHDWYTGRFILGTATVEVRLVGTTPTRLANLAAYASEQLRAAFYDALLARAEAKLVALKNDAWLDEDEETGEEEAPFTPEEFRACLTLDSIVFYADRSASVYYEDGDLFAGHYIELRATKKGTYAGAGLAG